MSNFTGMDIQAVRQLATQLNAKAGEIRNLTNQLTGQLEGTAWVGPDRERFYGDWTGQYVSALNNVAQGLEDAAQRATQNANQQEQASSS
jgi:uncharacterized protein YukE